MEIEAIIAIVIPCIMIIGAAVFHLVEYFNKNDDISCKVWAEQWDDLDKRLKYSKLGLIYKPNNDDDIIKYIKDENLKQLNEEKARVLDNMMCSSKQFEVALDQMRDCINKPTVKEVVDTMSDKQKEVMDFIVNPPVVDDVLTFEAIMSPNEMRKMLGMDEIEEVTTTKYDLTIGPATVMHEEEEPKPKKLEPLICKMCGGTVVKKGDIYECEYCGLHYELR